MTTGGWIKIKDFCQQAICIDLHSFSRLVKRVIKIAFAHRTPKIPEALLWRNGGSFLACSQQPLGFTLKRRYICSSFSSIYSSLDPRNFASLSSFMSLIISHHYSIPFLHRGIILIFYYPGLFPITFFFFGLESNWGEKWKNWAQWLVFKNNFDKITMSYCSLFLYRDQEKILNYLLYGSAHVQWASGFLSCTTLRSQ